jgi:hypothetical protein
MNPPTKTIKIDDETHQRLKEAAVLAKRHMYEILFDLVKYQLTVKRTRRSTNGKGAGK